MPITLLNSRAVIAFKIAFFLIFLSFIGFYLLFGQIHAVLGLVKTGIFLGVLLTEGQYLR